MRSRRGASLVELLVIMSACVSILTTSVVLVHRVMLVQSKARACLSAERSALRLSQQFRRDVHQAQEFSTQALEADIVLQLQLPQEESVQYSHVQGVVQRTSSLAGRIVAREEFTFPESSELAIRQADAPRRVILSLKNNPLVAADATGGAAFVTPVDLEVDACLGRDAKFQAISPDKEASP